MKQCETPIGSVFFSGFDFPLKVMLTNIWVPGLCEGSGCSDPWRTPRMSGREAKEHQVQQPRDNCRLGARRAARHGQRGRVATTAWGTHSPQLCAHRDRTTESAALYQSMQQSLKKKIVSVSKVDTSEDGFKTANSQSSIYFHLNITSYTLMFLATHYFQFC